MKSGGGERRQAGRLAAVFNSANADHEACERAHRQYTELADALLEAYCADAGVTTRELLDALKQTEQGAKIAARDRRALESVAAASDFNVFVSLASRINVELQIQAMRVLEASEAESSSSLTPTWRFSGYRRRLDGASIQRRRGKQLNAQFGVCIRQNRRQLNALGTARV